MVSLLTYDKDSRELEILHMLSKDLAAMLSEDYWNMEQAITLDKLQAILEDKPLMDMLMFDVTPKDAIECLLKVRKSYRETQLMIIADLTTSPMEYMKPGIMASSLLLRPWTKEQAREVLKEFFQAYIEKYSQPDDKNMFVIESKEGNLHIPYDQIYFFEAREKKIFICTGKEEYGFYYTIDKLAEELPEQFIRCHRGFIVNKYKIRKVVLSQNIIYLVDDLDVPLSRSYKSIVKGMGK
ncbi:MAG: LytTR family transcriptional regulator [Lachnospiraceae bacterium]|nr:LytTR family transcriptional regulator [Lachnospiraceae bacterium]